MDKNIVRPRTVGLNVFLHVYDIEDRVVVVRNNEDIGIVGTSGRVTAIIVRDVCILRDNSYGVATLFRTYDKVKGIV